MPVSEHVADLFQLLERLNRLEEQGETSRKSGNSPLDTEALRASISPSVLLQHDRLRSRGRRSIAEVRHGVCSGCHMGLPIGTAAALKHQTALLKCDNCGRYIFPAEDEPAPAPLPDLPPKQEVPKRRSKKLNEVD